MCGCTQKSAIVLHPRERRKGDLIDETADVCGWHARESMRGIVDTQARSPEPTAQDQSIERTTHCGQHGERPEVTPVVEQLAGNRFIELQARTKAR